MDLGSGASRFWCVSFLVRLGSGASRFWCVSVVVILVLFFCSAFCWDFWSLTWMWSPQLMTLQGKLQLIKLRDCDCDCDNPPPPPPSSSHKLWESCTRYGQMILKWHHITSTSLWKLLLGKHAIDINVGLMLGHRLRRWPSIKPALNQHRLFSVGAGGAWVRLISLVLGSCEIREHVTVGHNDECWILCQSWTIVP